MCVDMWVGEYVCGVSVVVCCLNAHVYECVLVRMCMCLFVVILTHSYFISVIYW